MSNFCDIMTLHLEHGKNEETSLITPHNNTNQLIDKEKTTESHLSKHELEIFERYGILPDELSVIEEALDDTIEKKGPKKMKEKEEDKYLGLSRKVFNYLEENYL